jgi:1-acyl-sn-glycerol-3-phosphate acyltransferase
VQYGMSRVLAGPFLRLLWRPEITGTEHIPAEGGAILASNHLSIVDSIFLPFMVDRPVTFAAKSEYFTGTRPIDRFTSAYMRATNQISVDRAQARAGQDMLEAALGLLREGALFGIYPEGTRSPDGRPELGPAGHPGGHVRDRPGAAAGAPGAAGGQDQDHRGQAADLRELPGPAFGGPAAAGGHGRGDAVHPGPLRAGVRAGVRVRAQGGTRRRP